VIGYAESGLEPGDIEFWETWRFAHMTQLEDYVRKHRPSFIAIDSLTACLAGMDVDLVRSNAGDVLYGLRDIANKYNCSIVILHHLNKSGGLRDSTSFVDNVSEVVKLTRPENNP
jgi:RecA-family ATPase